MKNGTTGVVVAILEARKVTHSAGFSWQQRLRLDCSDGSSCEVESLAYWNHDDRSGPQVGASLGDKFVFTGGQWMRE